MGGVFGQMTDEEKERLRRLQAEAAKANGGNPQQPDVFSSGLAKSLANNATVNTGGHLAALGGNVGGALYDAGHGKNPFNLAEAAKTAASIAANPLGALANANVFNASNKAIGERERKEFLDEKNAYEKAYPVVSAAGGLAITAPMMAVGGAANGATKAAGTLQKIANGIKTGAQGGATWGGLYGAGASLSEEDKKLNELLNIAMGVVGGAAGGALAGGAMSAANKVLEPALEKAAKMLHNNAVNIPTGAENTILKETGEKVLTRKGVGTWYKNNMQGDTFSNNKLDSNGLFSDVGQKAVHSGDWNMLPHAKELIEKGVPQKLIENDGHTKSMQAFKHFRNIETPINYDGQKMKGITVLSRLDDKSATPELGQSATGLRSGADNIIPDINNMSSEELYRLYTLHPQKYNMFKDYALNASAAKKADDLSKALGIQTEKYLPETLKEPGSQVSAKSDSYSVKEKDLVSKMNNGNQIYSVAEEVAPWESPRAAYTNLLSLIEKVNELNNPLDDYAGVQSGKYLNEILKPKAEQGAQADNTDIGERLKNRVSPFDTSAPVNTPAEAPQEPQTLRQILAQEDVETEHIMSFIDNIEYDNLNDLIRQIDEELEKRKRKQLGY